MRKFLSLIGIGAVWITCTGLIGLEVRPKPALDFSVPQPLFRERVFFDRASSPVPSSPFLSAFEARWRTERALETSA